MTDYKFNTKIRSQKINQVRKLGLVPAVIYGKKFQNINLELDEREFSKLYREAGSSNLIDLQIDNGESFKTLIHEIQKHPSTSKIIHVDFLKIDMKEKIKTEIPLQFVGETLLVVDQEGSLITSKDAVEVECMPSDLVDHINVDISVLIEFDQNIKVSDIRVPAGMEILDDPDEVVALVQPPRSEEELEALDEAVVENVEQIEVENAGAAPIEGEESAGKPESAAAEDKKE